MEPWHSLIGPSVNPAFWNCPSTLLVKTCPAIGFGPSQGLQDVESGMGLGITVQLQSVAIEAPGQFGVVFES